MTVHRAYASKHMCVRYKILLGKKGVTIMIYTQLCCWMTFSVRKNKLASS